MQLVNSSRFRSEDLRAAYDAALAMSETPHPAEFLVVEEQYSNGMVSAKQQDFCGSKVVTVSFSRHNGPRQATGLQVLATGRSIDAGSFGQLVKYLRQCVSTPGAAVIDRPSRTVPRWAKDLSFVERSPVTGEACAAINVLLKDTSFNILRELDGAHYTFVRLEEVASFLNLAYLHRQQDLENAHSSKARSLRSIRSRWMEAKSNILRNITKLAAYHRRLERALERGERLPGTPEE